MYALPIATFTANLTQKEITALHLLSQGMGINKIAERMNMGRNDVVRILAGLEFIVDLAEMTRLGKVKWHFSESPKMYKAG